MKRPVLAAWKDRRAQSVIGLVRRAGGVNLDWVRGYSDQWPAGHPAHAPAESFTWTQERFPISQLSNLTDDPKAWLKEERTNYVEDMGEAPAALSLRDPVIVVEGTDGKFYLWDGNHRVANAQVKGRADVPAYVGRRTMAKKADDINLFHGTSDKFDKIDTERGELGSHWGTPEQVNEHIDEGGNLTPIVNDEKRREKHLRDMRNLRVIPADINIKNPLRLRDVGHFDVFSIAGELMDLGIIDAQEWEDIQKVGEKDKNRIIQAAIVNAGYDGIIYLNRREGVGPITPEGTAMQEKHGYDWLDLESTDEEFKRAYPQAHDSYIVFDQSQIKGRWAARRAANRKEQLTPVEWYPGLSASVTDDGKAYDATDSEHAVIQNWIERETGYAGGWLRVVSSEGHEELGLYKTKGNFTGAQWEWMKMAVGLSENGVDVWIADLNTTARFTPEQFAASGLDLVAFVEKIGKPTEKPKRAASYERANISKIKALAQQLRGQCVIEPGKPSQGQCDTISEDLAAALAGEGMEAYVVDGEVITEKPMGWGSEGNAEGHVWVEAMDDSGTILWIDVTADQFNPGMSKPYPEIMISDCNGPEWNHHRSIERRLIRQESSIKSLWRQRRAAADGLIKPAKPTTPSACGPRVAIAPSGNIYDCYLDHAHWFQAHLGTPDPSSGWVRLNALADVCLSFNTPPTAQQWASMSKLILVADGSREFFIEDMSGGMKMDRTATVEEFRRSGKRLPDFVKSVKYSDLASQQRRAGMAGNKFEGQIGGEEHGIAEALAVETIKPTLDFIVDRWANGLNETKEPIKLTIHGVWLVGSRAASNAGEGSTRPNSDWDFAIGFTTDPEENEPGENQDFLIQALHVDLNSFAKNFGSMSAPESFIDFFPFYGTEPDHREGGYMLPTIRVAAESKRCTCHHDEKTHQVGGAGPVVECQNVACNCRKFSPAEERHEHHLDGVKKAILDILRQGPRTMAGVQDVLYTRGVDFQLSHKALSELIQENMIRKDDTARVRLSPTMESDARQFNHLVIGIIYMLEQELRDNGPRDPANLVALMMKPWGGIDPKFFQTAYEKALDKLEKDGKIEWSEAENAWKIPGTGRDVPETPADVPGMKPAERQKRIDALLDRWQSEPSARPQIEQQLKSLRAFRALFMVRRSALDPDARFYRGEPLWFRMTNQPGNPWSEYFVLGTEGDQVTISSIPPDRMQYQAEHVRHSIGDLDAGLSNGSIRIDPPPIPCDGCGREDLPLHTDNRCPGCSKNAPLDDVPQSTSEVPEMSGRQREVAINKLLDRWQSEPAARPQIEQQLKSLRAFRDLFTVRRAGDAAGKFEGSVRGEEENIAQALTAEVILPALKEIAGLWAKGEAGDGGSGGLNQPAKLNVNGVWLVGSRAGSTAGRKSDWDFAVTFTTDPPVPEGDETSKHELEDSLARALRLMAISHGGAGMSELFLDFFGVYGTEPDPVGNPMDLQDMDAGERPAIRTAARSWRLVQMDPRVLEPYEIHQDQAKIDALVKAYQNHEELPPLVAAGDESGAQLIDGHHRLIAAQTLGLTQVPVILFDYETYERRGGDEWVSDTLDSQFWPQWDKKHPKKNTGGERQSLLRTWERRAARAPNFSRFRPDIAAGWTKLLQEQGVAEPIPQPVMDAAVETSIENLMHSYASHGDGEDAQSFIAQWFDEDELCTFVALWMDHAAVPVPQSLIAAAQKSMNWNSQVSEEDVAAFNAEKNTGGERQSLLSAWKRRAVKDELWAPDPEIVKNTWRRYQCSVCSHVQAETTNHLGAIMSYCKNCSWAPSKGECYNPMGDGRCYRKFTYLGEIDERHQSKDDSVWWDTNGEAWKKRGSLLRSWSVRRADAAHGSQDDRGHDYDFGWDYEVEEKPDAKLVQMTEAIAADIMKTLIPKLGMFGGFEIGYLENSGSVAVFIASTASYPMIGIDLKATKEAMADFPENYMAGALRTSIVHELAHAIQEFNEMPYGEEEAENFARVYDDTGEIVRFWEKKKRRQRRASGHFTVCKLRTVTANDPLKKTIEINGVKVGIEWPKGTIRTWDHLPNNDYRVKMKADYGYIKGTEGDDGEEIDVYAGPNRESGKVFLVEQLKDDGSYDEEKYMLGYDDITEAKKSYLDHMEKENMGSIKAMAWEKFLDLVPKSQKKKALENTKEERQSLLSTWTRRAAANPDKDDELFAFQDSQIEPLPKELQNIPEANILGIRLENAGDIFRELVWRDYPDPGYIGEKTEKIARHLTNPQMSQSMPHEALLLMNQIAELFTSIDLAGKSPLLIAARDLNIALARQDLGRAATLLPIFDQVGQRMARKAGHEFLHSWILNECTLCKAPYSPEANAKPCPVGYSACNRCGDRLSMADEESECRDCMGAEASFRALLRKRASGVDWAKVQKLMKKYWDSRVAEDWAGGLDCTGDSEALNDLLYKAGMPAEHISGYYVPTKDELGSGGFIALEKEMSHDWLVLDGKIIDITHSQFGKPDYLITSVGDPRYITTEQYEADDSGVGERQSLFSAWVTRQAVSDKSQSQIGTIQYRGKDVYVEVPTVDLEQWVKLRTDDRIIHDKALGQQFDEIVGRMYEYAAKRIEPNANIRESMNISLYPDIERALEYYGYGLDEAKQNLSAPGGDESLKQAVFSMFEQAGLEGMSPQQSADLLMNMAVVLRDEFGLSLEDAKAKLSSFLIEYGGGGPENLHLNSLRGRWTYRRASEQKLLRELVCTVIGSDSGATNEAVLPKGAVVGVQPHSNDHTIFFYSPIYSKIIVRGRVMKSNQYSAPVQDFRAATDIGYGEGTGYKHGPECFCDECMANDDMSTHRCPTCGSRECPGDGHSIDCRKPGTMTLKDVPVETRDSLLDKFNKGEIDAETLRRRMKQIGRSRLRLRRAERDDRSDLQKMADQIHDFIKSNPKAERNEIIAHVEALWKYKREGSYDFGLENQVLSALGYLIEDEKRAKWTDKGWLTMKEPLMTVEEHLRGVDVAPGSQPVDHVMDGIRAVDVDGEKDRLLDEFSKGTITQTDLDQKLKRLQASAEEAEPEDEPDLTMEQKVQALLYEIARDNEKAGYIPDMEDLTREVTNFIADESGADAEQIDASWVQELLGKLEYPGWRNIATPENTKPDLPPGTTLNSLHERWTRRASEPKVRPSTGDAVRMVENAVIDLLRNGPSTISRDLHEILQGGAVSVNGDGEVDSWDAPFADMVSDVIGKMLDRGMIMFDGSTAEFSLLKEPEPTTPDHLPDMPESDRQKKVDALLDQLSTEKDPKKKKQIEQRLRSLQASVRRAGDIAEPNEHRHPGTENSCEHGWPGKKEGERGWCGRCGLGGK